jgi:DNA primase large subunit
MQLNSSKRRVSALPGSTQKNARTASAVTTFYLEPPSGEVSIEMFEDLGVKRLQVLKKIENLTAKGNTITNLDEELHKLVNKYELNKGSVDRISHFILRLAFCTTQENRTWFIDKEIRLFRYRFERADQLEKDALFAENKLRYEPCEDIPDCFSQLSVESPLFKVPFEEAIALIKHRKCLLHRGDAFVTNKDLISIVQAKFKAHLNKQLASCYRASLQVKPDRRVAPLLKSLGKYHVAPTYKGALTGIVTKEQIPMLANRSFPLCMSNLYAGLKADNHLKHGGRMQFGLFLKGRGLTFALIII